MYILMFKYFCFQKLSNCYQYMFLFACIQRSVALKLQIFWQSEPPCVLTKVCSYWKKCNSFWNWDAPKKNFQDIFEKKKENDNNVFRQQNITSIKLKFLLCLTVLGLYLAGSQEALTIEVFVFPWTNCKFGFWL